MCYIETNISLDCACVTSKLWIDKIQKRTNSLCSIKKELMPLDSHKKTFSSIATHTYIQSQNKHAKRKLLSSIFQG